MNVSCSFIRDSARVGAVPCVCHTRELQVRRKKSPSVGDRSSGNQLVVRCAGRVFQRVCSPRDPAPALVTTGRHFRQIKEEPRRTSSPHAHRRGAKRRQKFHLKRRTCHPRARQGGRGARDWCLRCARQVSAVLTSARTHGVSHQTASGHNAP